MKKKTPLIIALCLVLVVAGAGFLYSRLSDGPGAPASTGEESIQAPDFTVSDREGRPVSLQDFRGKPVVINFWATWCGFCVQEMPHFEEAYQTYGDEIHFLMIDATDGQRETVEKATAFIEEHGYTFPVYFDTGRSAVSAFSITGFPATFFLDAEGRAVARAPGAIDAEMLQQGIDLILPKS